MVSKIRKRANVEALINSKLGLKKFAKNLIEKQDEANKYVSSMMHDEISQVMAALKIQIGLIQKNKNHLSESELDQKIANALVSIESCLKKSMEVGTYVWPELLDILGLLPALNQMSLNFIKQNGIACQFVTKFESVEVDSEKLISIYRIATSALDNIIKHANASEVMIYLEEADDKFQLRIVDNGVGFNTRVNNDTKWYGFIEMKQRAMMINADLNIYSLKNRGTELVLVF